jgi:hypothetical protein
VHKVLGLSVDGLLDEGGRSMLFDSGKGVSLLQVLVECTSFVIGGVVAIAENSVLYSTGPCGGN